MVSPETAATPEMLVQQIGDSYGEPLPAQVETAVMGQQGVQQVMPGDQLQVQDLSLRQMTAPINECWLRDK